MTRGPAVSLDVVQGRIEAIGHSCNTAEHELHFTLVVRSKKKHIT